MNTEHLDPLYDRAESKKWSHPAMADVWGGGLGLSEASKDILDPALPVEQAEALRKEFEQVLLDLVSVNPIPAEIANAGTTSWAEVPVSDVEPGAPTMRVLLRSPNQKAEERFPVVFYVPVGGLALSNPEIYAPIFLRQSAELNAVIIAPEGRVAPRWQYPALVNDMQAAFLWMVNNAEELKIDLDRILIYGGSSGGHIAMALTHRMKRVGYPRGVRPRALILEYPVVEDREFMPSHKIHAPAFPPNEERRMWKAWLGDNYNHADLPPEAVPGHASGDDFKGLPPAFIYCMEHDPDRDDTIRYAQGLLNVGIYCCLHVWGGMSHSSMLAAQAEPVVRMNSLVMADMKDAITNDLRRA